MVMPLPYSYGMPILWVLMTSSNFYGTSISYPLEKLSNRLDYNDFLLIIRKWAKFTRYSLFG